MIILIGGSSGITESLLPLLLTKEKVLATFHKKEIRLENKNLVKVKLDLTSIKEIVNFSQKIIESDDRLIFINMAAISPDELVARLPLEAWKNAIDINLNSTFYMLQMILPKMIREKWGRIILMSSLAADQGPIGTSAYSSSKSALNGLNSVLAHEYGRFNITSNIIRLGYFNSGLINTFNNQKKKEILSRIPIKKLGTTDDLFKTINFIIETNYLNGSSIKLDGGYL